MIDTKQFDGHTAGPWYYGIAYDGKPVPLDYKSPGYYDNTGIIGADGETIAGCGEYHIFRSESDIRLMVAAPQLLAEVARLQAVQGELVRRLEKDIQRIEQLCNMANNLAGNLGLGQKVRIDDFTANARCGIKLAKES